MPPVRYPTGDGSTSSLPSQANAGRLNGVKSTSPSRPWTYASISDYNVPASIMYSDVAAANARNAFLIRQAQRRAEIEAQRRRLEEERRIKEMEAQQRLQEQTRATSREQQTQILLSQTPFSTASPGAIANYLGPQGAQALSNLTAGPAPQSAISDLFQRAQGIAAARVSSASDEAVRRIMEGSYENLATTKQLTSPTIYDEIVMLENSYEARKARAAVEAWGRPRELTYYDAESGQVVFGGWDWSYTGEGADGWGRPVEYLGLERGQVAAPQPTPPPEGAPYSEVAAYRDQLKQSIRKPLYRPESVMDTLYAMGPDGVKQLQKQALRAQWYDTNDVVKFGVIGEKEISWMTDLMSLANINGTTWEEMFSQEIQGSLEAAARASASGGYGGGGGGGGTTVYKQIQYTQTSVAQARTLLVGILRDALGREPTDSEVSKFVAILNKAESKSPTRTVTKTTTGGDMTRAVSRTTPSTVDPEALAQEFAQSIRGGAPYEANAQARYLSALLESLGSASV